MRAGLVVSWLTAAAALGSGRHSSSAELLARVEQLRARMEHTPPAGGRWHHLAALPDLDIEQSFRAAACIDTGKAPREWCMERFGAPHRRHDASSRRRSSSAWHQPPRSHRPDRHAPRQRQPVSNPEPAPSRADRSPGRHRPSRRRYSSGPRRGRDNNSDGRSSADESSSSGSHNK